MDLLIEIKGKLSSLDGHTSREGVEAAVRHIDVAERWFGRGRKERDDDMFNDVIYRTNQAFEGMLKEAYSVLGGKDASGLTPFEIEKRLIDEEVFTGRITDLFRNYRQEWRNKSTHDHKLFFGEQEAILGIVSVSAFATILIDQIIEKVAEERERIDVQSKKQSLEDAISSSPTGTLRDEVVSLLKLFSDDLLKSKVELDSVRESELLGRMTGFIQGVAPNIDLVSEPKHVVGKRIIRPDLVLRRGNSKVVVELKRGTPKSLRSVRDMGLSQVMTYMNAIGAKSGVLYIAPFEKYTETKEESFEISTGGSKHTAVVLYPSMPADSGAA